MSEREYSKRERKRRGVNVSAIEKFKQARSGQSKSIDNVKDEEAIYEYVTEDQYADIINSRIQDDWVVGDVKGSGYDDTGREIFDDELEDWEDNVGKSGGTTKKRKKPSNVRSSAGGAITQFLKGKSGKAQSETKTLGTDALLDELLNTLDEPQISSCPSIDQDRKTKFVSKQVHSVPQKLQAIKPTPTRFLQKKPVVKQERIEAVEYTPDCEVSNIPFTNNNNESDISPPVIVDEDSMDMMIMNDDDDEAIAQAATEAEKHVKTEITVKVETKPEVNNQIPSNWSSPVFVDETAVKAEVNFDKGTLPLVDFEGDKVFKMYCTDVHENSYNNPGIVYLIGKVEVSTGKYTSGTVAVRNIPRVIFLLPREIHPDTGEEIKMLDVYNEWNDVIAPRFKINKFASKPSEKKFAWNVANVPYESEYLEVRYSAEYPSLPFNLEGKTFHRVFGTNQTAQELLILQNKLKGPSWIMAKNCHVPRQPSTWSTYEVCIEKMSDLIVCKDHDTPPPPLCCVSLAIKTLLNPKTNANEIVCIGVLIQSKFNIDKAAPKPAYEQHFAAIASPQNQVYPYDFEKVNKNTSTNIEVFKSERAMLGWFVARFQKIDPDIIMGYDCVFQIDVLLHRLSAVKVPHWSRISRFKRTQLPKSFGSTGLVGVGVMAGRIIADSKISCKELIRLRKYDLTELAKIILRENRIDFEQDHLSKMFDTSKNLIDCIHHTLNDASLNLRVMFELMALPLSHQITKLCGNVWQRTLLGGRAERNEYLLLHAFFEQQFIVPDKRSLKMKAMEAEGDEEGGKKKNTYSGGLVLEPKKGFYDTYILLLDFNSLYPSIIQEYNVCFTTVDNSTVNEDGIVEAPSSDSDPGILPAEIKKLVDRRKDVKGLLKNEIPGSDKYLQYDIRQKALKLTANSMYGCLGFSNSRFYAKALAALVTAKGREALLAAKDLVEANMRLEVVYGDTDSIMINTHSTDISEVLQLGRQVKAEVNKMYRLLEIDIDGVFKSMLLLKKKKYAAISLHVQGDGSFREEKELKGLDIVRRDWCDLAKEAGSRVLDSILSTKNRDEVLEEIHSYLTDVGKAVADDTVVMQKFVIQKSLTKAPSEYPDKKSQPHVQVALRLISQGKRVVSGDVVEYVICEDGTGSAATQRAYHPSELSNQADKLKIDKQYYLSSQLHPVVSRLCGPIDGTDTALIAECLGLDPTSYKKQLSSADNTSDVLCSITDEERYKDCVPLELPCQHCNTQLTIQHLASGNPAVSSYECTSCKKTQTGHYISNKLVLATKNCINKYYNGLLRCEDTACGYITRHTPLNSRCTHCHRGNVSYVISEGTLNTQLNFYLNLVDFKKFCMRFPKNSPKLDKISHLQHTLNIPYKSVSKIVEKNGFSQIDLTKLFQVLGS